MKFKNRASDGTKLSTSRTVSISNTGKTGVQFCKLRVGQTFTKEEENVVHVWMKIHPRFALLLNSYEKYPIYKFKKKEEVYPVSTHVQVV
jgi:hypothetical protein